MSPTALTHYLTIAESVAVIISALAAGGAAWFAAGQISQMKRAGEVDAFLRILDAGNREPVNACAAWVKYEMADDLTYEVARADRAVWDKIGHVEHHFETIGILVARNYISEDLIYDQMGPWITGSWAKLERLIAAHRTARRAPDYGENFEVLATRYEAWAADNPPKLEKRSRASKEAARNYYRSSPNS